MPRQKNAQDAAELGALLTEMRAERYGDSAPGLDRMIREVFELTGVWISGEQLRRYHRGDVDPHTADLGELAALAAFYRLRLEDLSAAAAERFERTQRVVVMLDELPPRSRRSTPRRRPRGQRPSTSGWSSSGEAYGPVDHLACTAVSA